MLPRILFSFCIYWWMVLSGLRCWNFALVQPEVENQTIQIYKEKVLAEEHNQEPSKAKNPLHANYSHREVEGKRSMVVDTATKVKTREHVNNMQNSLSSIGEERCIPHREGKVKDRWSKTVSRDHLSNLEKSRSARSQEQCVDGRDQTRHNEDREW